MSPTYLHESLYHPVTQLVGRHGARYPDKAASLQLTDPIPHFIYILGTPSIAGECARAIQVDTGGKVRPRWHTSLQ